LERIPSCLKQAERVLEDKTSSQEIVDKTLEQLKTAASGLSEVSKEPTNSSEVKKPGSVTEANKGMGKNPQSSESTNSQKQGKLPATGEAVTHQFIFLGGVVLIACLGGLVLNKRRDSKN